ncbi:uncharacterized protein E0L32_005672 [Thyridium curvatum]|uniref:Uncharacterized protein n=1 Tax=Thyridium curvatum TaxID=1093900 RepID=A0A507AVH1_9PEZI|nr:uncharacterized protein E0L32_005672 [Thyridium curvatum]TPX13972.1 hypothetical protein E0L32_005672 [Thyridium curvatum]
MATRTARTFPVNRPLLTGRALSSIFAPRMPRMLRAYHIQPQHQTTSLEQARATQTRLRQEMIAQDARIQERLRALHTNGVQAPVSETQELLLEHFRNATKNLHDHLEASDALLQNHVHVSEDRVQKRIQVAEDHIQKHAQAKEDRLQERLQAASDSLQERLQEHLQEHLQAASDSLLERLQAMDTGRFADGERWQLIVQHLDQERRRAKALEAMPWYQRAWASLDAK